MADPLVNLISQQARKRGLDPAAVLAVARQEGLSGRVGDNGTSFGPFQLHRGGALPAGIPLATAQQWATSPAGINYALDRIASVAAGKAGANAVRQIVSRFERPADPASEIARAISSLPQFAGQSSKIGGAPAPSLAAPPSIPSGPNPDVLNLLAAGASLFGFDSAPLSQLALQAPAPLAPAPKRTPQAAVPAVTVPKKKSGKAIRFLEQFAAPFGLEVTSTTGGKHVKGSYHYRGRAVDFGGDPSRLASLAAAALEHPQDFSEMFYTGPGNPGFFIKNGQVIPLSKLDKSVAAGHTTHVHLAA